MSFIPWFDPTKKLTKQLMGALAKSYPDINMNEKHFYTFEALLIAADAFKRAGGADPRALVDAIRATNITDNISMGPGIQFNEKGQNDKLKSGAIQNRAGKFAIIGPKAQSDANPELPMTPYDKRG
jgi:branched-chain amino acid transport system substrate-binding protein